MRKLLCFLTILVSVVFAAAWVYAEEVYEENGDYVTLTVVEEQPAALGAARLSAPTNLIWNPGSKKGFIQWDAVDGCEGEYYIAVYRNGEEVFSTTWSDLYDNDGNGVVDVSVIHADVFTGSGNYTFSVQALGDGVNYLDSSTAYSSMFKYTLPSAKLSAPENLQWDDSGVLIHSAVKNAGGYKYNIYNQNKECIGDTSYTDSVPITDLSDVEEELASYLIEITGWEENIEAFYITVTALTYDIEKYQSSPESAFSQRIPVSEIGVQASGSLEDLLNNAYDGSISAEQALSGFISGMENEGTTNTELAMNMQQDSSLVEQIGELESLYCEENGIAVNVQNQAGSGYLEERGIDVSKVEIIGAALNSDGGKDVSLNFYEADSSVSADELFYKNSIAVDISMDGVENAQNLAIPVQIKIPIPSGVVPGRIVILHYHSDGSMEEIRPVISVEDGEFYITFVLTSFSTFVFCNEEEAAITVSVNSQEEVQLSGGLPGSVIAAALYDKSGKMKSVKLLSPEAEMNVNFSDAASTDYVKLIWFDSLKTLAPVCVNETVTISEAK